jgi:hypothetical protein
MDFTDCFFDLKEEFKGKINLETLTMQLLMSNRVKRGIHVDHAHNGFATYFPNEEVRSSIQKIKDFIPDFDKYFVIRTKPSLE